MKKRTGFTLVRFLDSDYDHRLETRILPFHTCSVNSNSGVEGLSSGLQWSLHRDVAADIYV
jgi:hypothetical protein